MWLLEDTLSWWILGVTFIILLVIVKIATWGE